jgi:hypothetical protein
MGGGSSPRPSPSRSARGGELTAQDAVQPERPSAALRLLDRPGGSLGTLSQRGILPLMVKPPRDEHWGLLGEPPSEVEVTMLTSPRRRSVDHGAIVVRRVLRPRMMLSAAAVAMATIGVVAAATLGGRGPTGIPRSSTASPVAAISPYRLSCLGVAMALHGPRFSRGGSINASAAMPGAPAPTAGGGLRPARSGT